MQRQLITVVLFTALLGLSAAASADRGDRHRDGGRHWSGGGHGYAPHHARRSRTGVYLNLGPLWWPGYPAAYYPLSTPSTVVVTPPAPTTYVQQPAEGSGYWYYCQSSQSYYPYVRSCPDGWMKVVPDAPGN